MPDEIERWPVSMIAEIDVADLKRLFSRMARQLLDEIHGSRKQ